jgi:hypothetical protein
MLLRFRAGQADFARRFAEAGQAADPSGQERCAHTLVHRRHHRRAQPAGCRIAA